MQRSVVLLAAAAALLPSIADAQWRNRYPRLANTSHHVYVEGYELPVLNAGPSDPAPSPDGRTVAIASRGWLWLLDPASGTATRLTRGGAMDSRPAWSPDGRSIAFVRDDGRTLAVVVRDLASGAEREIERGFAMDPAFAPDGKSLYYASNAAGGLDLWRIDLASGAKTRLTSDVGLELRPMPHPDGRRVAYVFKSGGGDQIRVRTLADSSETILASGHIAAQMRAAISPDGQHLAFTSPRDDGWWELRLASVDRPGGTVQLVSREGGLPLSPAFSADGREIWFMQGDARQQLRLHRIATAGGTVTEVPVRRWEWGEPTARVVVRTRVRGASGAAPMRLSVTDGRGHPVVGDSGQPRFDGQTGRVYFYSPGTIELTVPAGAVEVTAAHGIAAPPRTARVQVAAGQTREVELELAPVWDARANGWYSGDHHYHLAFGGQFPLRPEDMLLPLRGEDLDVATPLVGNLHNRMEHQEYWPWRRLDARPLVRFGQEVRPHFLGHTGLIGTSTFFWPWIWGPGYQVYGRDDRTNAEPLQHARQEGGIATYMHPVQPLRADPFASDEALASIPIELVADGALGLLDAIELVCLWSDEIGTGAVWHRLLSIGMPVAPNAGTDAMLDFYRTMAVGTTRVYVRPVGALDMDGYLRALRAGRSFVTTGPMLDVRIGGMQPGDVLARGDTTVAFAIDLHTAVPVDSVEVLVNGRSAWRGRGVQGTGSRRLTGTVRVPSGGWIAVRALGPSITEWPGMDSYVFAHTAPVWIGRVGSTEPEAARAAARDLLRALDVAERRLVAGYAGTEIPRLRVHFQRARAALQAHAGG